MKAIEFMYWLQGALEQNPKASSFDKEQTACIKRHLAMAKITEYKMVPFCNWLEGYFDMVNPESISGAPFQTLKTKLYDCFEHKVDMNTTPTKVSPQTNALHQSIHSTPLRC